MAEIITNILITILNREIIPTFKKFTFHPSSHKLDQNGFRRPEEKENAIHQHKKVIIFSQELVYVHID